MPGPAGPRPAPLKISDQPYEAATALRGTLTTFGSSILQGHLAQLKWSVVVYSVCTAAKNHHPPSLVEPRRGEGWTFKQVETARLGAPDSTRLAIPIVDRLHVIKGEILLKGDGMRRQTNKGPCLNGSGQRL
jgi:hypothetical protein